MRPIRQLRAWDKENNRWVYSGRTPSMMRSFWKWVMYDVNTPICEETGLKDKNGVGIYEGDIVQLYEEEGGANIKHKPALVVWDDAEARFIPEGKPHIYWSYYFSITVIGNIHENKELLK